MMSAKWCARCKERKVENEFPNGSGSYCILCKREDSREREQTRERDHHAANRKRWARYRSGIRDAFVDYLEDVPQDVLIDWFVSRAKTRVVSLVKFVHELDAE
jgi:hypothetical protein